MSVNPWRGLKGLPAEVWVLCAATLVNRAGTMALPFLALYLTSRLGVTASQAGLGLAVYGVGALITGPLAGRLCDRVGAARVLKGSLFVSGLLVMALPALGGFASFLGLTFVWAVAGEAFRPASLMMVTDLVRAEQRKPAIALMRLAINLGMSVGPAAGGFLAMVSFPVLFIVDGATSLLAGVVVAMSRWPPHAREAGPETPPGAPARRRGWLPDAGYLYFLVSMLPAMMVFFQIHAAMPLHLVRNLHLTEAAFGLLLSVNTVLVVLLEVPLNMATSHWPHRRSLVLGSLLVGIGFGSMALASGFTGVAMTVVVWTFGEILLLPASAACVADLAPPGRRGEYMGLYTMGFSLAFVIGPWAGAAALDRFGPALLWSGVFLAGCLSAAMMSRIQAVPTSGPLRQMVDPDPGKAE